MDIFSTADKERIKRSTLNANNHNFGEYSWTNAWTLTCGAAFPNEHYYEVVHEQPTVDEPEAGTTDKVDLQVVIYLEDRKVVVLSLELKDPDNFNQPSAREKANVQIVDRLDRMLESKDEYLPRDIPIISAFGADYKRVFRNDQGFFPAMHNPDPNYLNPARAPQSEWNCSLENLKDFAVLALQLRQHFDRVIPIRQRKAAFDTMAERQMAKAQAVPVETLPEYAPPNYGLPVAGLQLFLPLQFADTASVVSSMTYSSADSEDNFIAQDDKPIPPSQRKLRPRKQ